MEIIIKKADYEDAKVANSYLTKLIHDEKKYDSNINEKCIVKSLYEKFYNEESVCLLIAKEKDKPIGYLYGFIIEDGDSVIEKKCQLDAMYVDEEKRNNGVGKKLINEFKKWVKSKNIKYVELKVCKQNKNAINLYKSFNFVEIKKIYGLKW